MGARAPGLFVTATDTGVGKTVLSGALLAAMAGTGERVRAHKPVVTGTDEPPGEWPQDHQLLADLTGASAEEVAPARFGPAVSPHLAAALAGSPLRFAEVVAEAQEAVAEAQALSAICVVEGVGGLLAPLTDERTVCDLAAELRLPVVVAARPGLGTINHTLLTLRAARATGLVVCAVVLTPWPPHPSEMERSNRDTIAHMGQVEVTTLGPIAGPQRALLAAAGETLPWQRWLALP